MSVFKQQAGRRNAIGRKVFMAIAATSMMSAMCVSPVYAAPGDDHDRAGQRYGHDQRDDRHDRDHGRRDDHRYDRRDYGHPYYYAQPVYVPPPVYVEPQQSVGINLFLPLNFRR